MICIVAAPFFLIGFYLYNFKRWQDEEFIEKYGTPLDDLKTNSRLSIVFSLIFIMRRGIFAVMTVFNSHFVF